MGGRESTCDCLFGAWDMAPRNDAEKPWSRLPAYSRPISDDDFNPTAFASPLAAANPRAYQAQRSIAYVHMLTDGEKTDVSAAGTEDHTRRRAARRAASGLPGVPVRGRQKTYATKLSNLLLRLLFG